MMWFKRGLKKSESEPTSPICQSCGDHPEKFCWWLSCECEHGDPRVREQRLRQENRERLADTMAQFVIDLRRENAELKRKVKDLTKGTP